MFGNNSQARLRTLRQQQKIEEEYNRSAKDTQSSSLLLGLPSNPNSSSVSSRNGPVKTTDYHIDAIYLPKTQSRRTFKVCELIIIFAFDYLTLTFQVLTYEKGLGKDMLGIEYREMGTNNLFYRTPSQVGKAILNNIVLYDSKQIAIQAANSIEGSGKLQRCVAAFDCWGQVRRKLRDFPSSEYEYAKLVQIVEYLDHSKLGTRTRKWDAAKVLTEEDIKFIEARNEMIKAMKTKSLSDDVRQSSPKKKLISILNSPENTRTAQFQLSITKTKINLPGNCNEHQ